ncbi:MAG: DUF452 family protein [Muribaculaceae bacterium]|nr:DUF452 family protein [Muribaculaceae bacterium]
MKIEFLHKAGSDRLILIVAGWGSDARTFVGLGMPGWDLAVIYGLDEHVPDLNEVNSYATIYLYAWSLGVWATCNIIGHKLIPTKAFAINGTPTPYDELRGIPPMIFDGTVNTLIPRNLHKFRVRMCGGVQAYNECAHLFAGIEDVAHLRQELLFVRDHAIQPSLIKWDAAFIATNDKIFPPQNQENAWQGHTLIHHLAGEHFIDSQSILRQTIVDTEQVGRRFTRSLVTYDAHSHAQRLIAQRLAQLMSSRVRAKRGDVIEIGCGTGNFTREWSKYFRARHAHFVDLCKLPIFDVAPYEHYHTCDAEMFMAEQANLNAGRIDAIFSASTIQWFNNLPLFFSHCSRTLADEGILCVSTFAPGNLSELQILRPDHLQYIGIEEVNSIVTNFFKDVTIKQEEVVLEFTTPLDALRHLQLTGVTASGSRKAAVGELREFIAHYPMNDRGRYTLTFRPIYIIATHPLR